jgi:hypothetical protein
LQKFPGYRGPGRKLVRPVLNAQDGQIHRLVKAQGRDNRIGGHWSVSAVGQRDTQRIFDTALSGLGTKAIKAAEAQ